MENSPDLLSQSQVESLVGRRHDILDAAERHRRRFDAVLPNYMFLGTWTTRANAIRLISDATARPSPASRRRPTRRRSLGPWKTLGAGQPGLRKPAPVGKRRNRPTGLPAPSGESTPALAGLLLNDSRYLRDSVGERLRQTSDGEAGGEAPKAGSRRWSWGKSADGSHGSKATGIQSAASSRRRQPGRQRHAPRPGGGYSNSSLNMDSSLQSSASIDSYHLGAYLGRQLQQWRLSLAQRTPGTAPRSSATCNTGAVAGKQKAKLDAQSSQLFAEAAYALGWRSLELEPFAGLAYVHVASDDFRERVAPAAPEGGDDNLTPPSPPWACARNGISSWMPNAAWRSPAPSAGATT